MTEWTVFSAIFIDGSKSEHLVGQVLIKGVQVSPEIKNFTPKTKTIVTHNGRIYKLAGRPRYLKDCDDWSNWRKIHQVTSYQDCTDLYVQKINSIS